MIKNRPRLSARFKLASFMLAALCLSHLCGCSKGPASWKPGSDETALQRMMEGITKGIETLSGDLEAAAGELGKTGLTGDEARDVLKNLCSKHRSALIDCAAIDDEGVIATVEPKAFRTLEGTDVHRHPVNAQLIKTKEPSLSQIFMTAERIAAVAFEWPVFSDDGVFMGSVSTLIDPKLFIKPLIKRALSLPVYAGWVAQTNGIILYSPDPNQTGRNIFKDPYYRHMKELVALGRKISTEESGRGTFRRKGAGKVDFVERLCIWDTIDFHNARWRVILVKNI
ncbi:MAG TPA: hypothetical protein PLZ86_06715 [bacterium]|nr:hypothetical protein [bacterium]